MSCSACTIKRSFHAVNQRENVYCDECVAKRKKQKEEEELKLRSRNVSNPSSQSSSSSSSSSPSSSSSTSSSSSSSSSVDVKSSLFRDVAESISQIISYTILFTLLVLVADWSDGKLDGNIFGYNGRLGKTMSKALSDFAKFFDIGI